MKDCDDDEKGINTTRLTGLIIDIDKESHMIVGEGRSPYSACLFVIIKRIFMKIQGCDPNQRSSSSSNAISSIFLAC